MINRCQCLHYLWIAQLCLDLKLWRWFATLKALQIQFRETLPPSCLLVLFQVKSSIQSPFVQRHLYEQEIWTRPLGLTFDLKMSSETTKTNTVTTLLATEKEHSQVHRISRLTMICLRCNDANYSQTKDIRNKIFIADKDPLNRMSWKPLRILYPRLLTSRYNKIRDFVTSNIDLL